MCAADHDESTVGELLERLKALHDAFDAQGLSFDECDTLKARLLERVAVRLAGEDT